MKQRQERESNISRVIKTAQNLFINDGIYATSINRIAAESDLAPMSIYRYFNNKDTLVYAVWQDALVDFYSQYMSRYSALLREGMTGFDKYVLAMDLYFQIYKELPQWFSYTLEMFSYSPSEKNGKDGISVFWHYYDKEIPIPALKALREGVKDGSIRSDVNIYAAYQCQLNAYSGLTLYENMSFGVASVDIIRFTADLITNYIKNTG